MQQLVFYTVIPNLLWNLRGVATLGGLILKRFWFSIPSIVFVIALAGTAHAQPASNLIEVTDAWVRVPTSDGGPATAYFSIFNKSHEEDYLIRVTSPAAERSILQRMRIHNFKAVFDTVPKLGIDAIKRRRLRPGEYQITLQRLIRPLRVGDTVPLTLTFERAGRIEVTARVSNQMLGNR